METKTLNKRCALNTSHIQVLHPGDISCCEGLFTRKVFTARKRNLQRLCFHSCLSTVGSATHPWADTPRQTPSCPVHAGIHTAPAQYMLEYTHTPAQCMLEYTPQQILWDMVNKRAVRIPLECILVYPVSVITTVIV